MPSALAFHQVVKDYPGGKAGPVRALGGIDLDVPEGEVFGFLGPNGAGKSTAIRILLDLIRPTAGRAEIAGLDAQRDSVEARRHVGYLPSDPVFPAGLTAMETFGLYARVRGSRLDDAYLRGLIERLDLNPTRRVQELSRGNRQKVGIVAALMAHPAVVVLDEPTTGLDPLVQEEVERILREYAAGGGTVFFSSHVLTEVEQICTRAAILRRGEIVDVFHLAEQRRLAPRRIEATFAHAVSREAFAALPSTVRVAVVDERRVEFETQDGVDAVVKALAQHEVVELISREATLEELFMRFYRSDGDAEEAR